MAKRNRSPKSASSATKSPELSGQPQADQGKEKPLDGDATEAKPDEPDAPEEAKTGEPEDQEPAEQPEASQPPAEETAPEPEATSRTAPADTTAPELAGTMVDQADDEPYVHDDDRGPPTADEMYGTAPTVRDLIDAGYTEKQSEQLREAFMDMVQRARDILKPELVEAECVKVRSTAEAGHYRLKRHWAPTFELFALDDPFLSQANIKVLEDDTRIQITFPE